MEIKNNVGLSCFLCGEDHPAVLKKIERHHIDGRVYSDSVIAICQNCHNKISLENNVISPRYRSKANTNKVIKIGNLILNHGALLKYLAETQIKISKELIDYEKNNVESIHKDKK
jgi:hypothetical protein